MCLVPAVTLTTKDNITVTVGSYLGYEITDMDKLYNTLHDASDTIEAMCVSSLAEYVCTHTLEENHPDKIVEHMNKAMDFEQYGFGGSEFFISNFASVKTYRFITGEIRQWSGAEAINTRDHTSTVEK